jgi:hypothetical protein
MPKLQGHSGSAGYQLETDDPVLASLVDNGDANDTSASVAVSKTVSTPAPLTQALYATENGDVTPISVGDIHQGQIGDCFLLAAVGEIALLKPSFISNMIRTNAGGTETVGLYEAANGHLPNWNTTTFKPIAVTVSNVFPNYSVNNAAGQDIVNGVKEIWPQVLEKAYATLNGGYGGIMNGGSPIVAMEELTGHAAICSRA